MFPTSRTFLAGVIVSAVAAAGAAHAIRSPRALDGRGNNPAHPDWGSAGTMLLRLAPAAYEDGYESMAGHTRPDPRTISNVLADQPEPMRNPGGMSDMVWQWGQFLDHDLDLTPSHSPSADPDEAENIATDPADPWFVGTSIGFMRSLYDPATSVPGIPRQQINRITSFIDASNVYGSDPVRAAALRAHDGSGRLAMSEGDLLPFNTAGLPNAQPAGLDPGRFFLAGDVRANEQAGLTAMHTLFVREHNRIADLVRGAAPWLEGDVIYEAARRIVIAECQIITYKEFLPALLGPGAIPPYRTWRPQVNPSIANLFSTAGYRFGHSAVSSVLLRLDERLEEIPQGHLPLARAFFDPSRILAEGGIEPLLRGLTQQAMQVVDPFVVSDLRNFLFGPPGSGGLDLVSLNIQRGRDHGLPDYNRAREAMGLARRESLDAISGDPVIRERLHALYDDVDDVDVWVGGLAEDHVEGALVGELMYHIIRDQFIRLRDGDRFWYERSFHPFVARFLEQQTLAAIIRRNTAIGDEIPDDVFRVPRAGAPRPGR